MGQIVSKGLMNSYMSILLLHVCMYGYGRQYTCRTRIAQSLVLPPVANEPASPLRDDSQGEACPTDSGFKADQDRANIAKTSTLPKKMATVLTSMDAASILTIGGVQVVPTAAEIA
nr:hypothetical protein [Tanacetum cinerariifolium]